MAKCKNCESELLGRSDKKYCSDQCRSEYYNRSHGQENKYIREVNTILKKNRTILKALNPTGKNKVHRDMLLQKGFRFEYCTNIYTTKAGKEYTFCYDHGYLPLGNDFFALVIRDTNRNK